MEAEFLASLWGVPPQPQASVGAVGLQALCAQLDKKTGQVVGVSFMFHPGAVCKRIKS